jgi:hypothetical protein
MHNLGFACASNEILFCGAPLTLGAVKGRGRTRGIRNHAGFGARNGVKTISRPIGQQITILLHHPALIPCDDGASVQNRRAVHASNEFATSQTH